MPAAIKKAGLTHVPCITHVANLGLGKVLEAFAIKGLIDNLFNVFKTAKRARLLKATKFNPGVLRCPDHRFKPYEAAMHALLDKGAWDRVLGVVQRILQAEGSKLNKDLRKELRSLLADLDDEGVRVNTHLAYQLARGLPRIISASETNIGDDTAIDSINELWTRSREFHAQRATVVRALVTKFGFDWTEKEILNSIERVALAMEELTDTFLKHFTDGSGAFVSLPVLTMCHLWNPSSKRFIHRPANAGDHAAMEEYQAWMEAVGFDVTDSEHLAALTTFHKDLASGAIAVADGQSLFDFYYALPPKYAMVRDAAVFVLGLPTVLRHVRARLLHQKQSRDPSSPRQRTSSA